MAVATGEQRRPRRRAERRDVEAVVAEALVRHPRVVRRVDRPAEGRGVSEAGVVDQHQQDIRRPVGRLDVTDRLPVRLRAVERLVRHSRERLPADRELASIGLAHRLPPEFQRVEGSYVSEQGGLLLGELLVREDALRRAACRAARAVASAASDMPSARRRAGRVGADRWASGWEVCACSSCSRSWACWRRFPTHVGAATDRGGAQHGSPSQDWHRYPPTRIRRRSKARAPA